jgi:hypothetical protein
MEIDIYQRFLLPKDPWCRGLIDRVERYESTQPPGLFLDEHLLMCCHPTNPDLP